MRLILIILIAIVATPALPNSIRVGKKESFQSIAQAIAAAKRLASGDRPNNRAAAKMHSVQLCIVCGISPWKCGRP